MLAVFLLRSSHRGSVRLGSTPEAGPTVVAPPFPEDTPERLIASTLPDVLVKGGDYKAEEIAGAKDVLGNGGEVRILAFREGHSSSRIIEKLSE